MIFPVLAVVSFLASLATVVYTLTHADETAEYLLGALLTIILLWVTFVFSAGNRKDDEWK